MIKDAILVGPFIGELYWEMYRFAPYIIHLKKEIPNKKFIVFTRPDRFDLYGKYADILVALNFKRRRDKKEIGFGIDSFNRYDLLKKFFIQKYKHRYNIVDHIFPDSSSWRSRIKWQFPRSDMDYDFRPRQKNYSVVKGVSDSTNVVFVCGENKDVKHKLLEKKYNPVLEQSLIDIALRTDNVSYIGCLIVLLQECKFVVGNMNSIISRLALLLKIPVISINESMTYDGIHLLNPFETPVINCFDLEEGVDIYENNIRS